MSQSLLKHNTITADHSTGIHGNAIDCNNYWITEAHFSQPTYI